MFIDTHCHLENNDQTATIINNALENNVQVLIVSGCDPKTNEIAAVLSQKYDNVYATIGYHPEEVNTLEESDLFELEKLLEEYPKIIGIGEIGLDYHYDGLDKELQQKWFTNQLLLSQKYHKPVVIHNRDAYNDTLNILNKVKPVKGILHCYTGSLEMANEFIKLGLVLGIGGVCTFKNSRISEVIKNIDMKYIVLETDSPYLSPEPLRGMINTPANIPIIAAKVASIKGMTVDEVADTTTSNARCVFDF